jgi:hypothetical protein
MQRAIVRPMICDPESVARNSGWSGAAAAATRSRTSGVRNSLSIAAACSLLRAAQNKRHIVSSSA